MLPTALAPLAPPRPTNCVTDLMLCVMHFGFLARVISLHTRGAAPKTSAGRQMRTIVVAYFSLIGAWQVHGAWCHIFAPGPDRFSLPWLWYIVNGALCPCLYGAALSLDQHPSHISGQFGRRLALAFGTLFVAFSMLAFSALNLAEYLPVPRTLEIALSPSSLERLRSMHIGWLDSALKADQARARIRAKQGVTDTALLLVFDGRGFARTPFAEAFDAKHATNFDLVAGFPSWHTHSLGFLFLVFGIVANTIQLLISAHAASRPAVPPCGDETVPTSRSESGSDSQTRQNNDRDDRCRRQRRAATCVRAHLGMTIAVTTMPLAMMVGGVPAGIDWMHICAGIGMYFQCVVCEQAIGEADRNAEIEGGGAETTSRKKVA